jgi:hypothetical protein
LQGAPFNLIWGSIVYAKIQAINLVGSSAVSIAGNGAVILTNPDPPSLLANNAGITKATVIALTWVAPTFIGGSAVTNYEVSWDQGSGTNIYAVLAPSITTSSYSTTATLNPNMQYKFMVKSRNAFG